MPTYRQAAFLTRALKSLLAQTFTNWEAVVVDDGSPDNTQAVLKPFIDDPRIRVIRFRHNRGLGAALNSGLGAAHSDIVTYFPTDDVLYPNHLETLYNALVDNNADVAISGVFRECQEAGVSEVVVKTSQSRMDGESLQLAQVMHRKTDLRWVERSELVTDDLDRMFFAKLCDDATVIETKEISYEWVYHPKQHHRIVREPSGGVNPYRAWYNVSTPMKFHSSVGSLIDEQTLYEPFRSQRYLKRASGLKIVLAGSLAFYPERILALAERGHELYGLWPQDGMDWFNTVGPLPFGHVTDIDPNNWRAEIERIKPDVIYGLLNFQVVPFVHEVMQSTRDIPFVFHFKEGPHACLSNGTWPELVDLLTLSDGQIYSSPEQKTWLENVLPSTGEERNSISIDGDLPPATWFTGQRAPRLGDTDGDVHTVVAGQPLGLKPELFEKLGQSGVHLHMYGDFYRARYSKLVNELREAAPDHLHLHPQVYATDWVDELSQYDAGWLHCLPSGNGGDLTRASWADLNYPARLSTMACAGLPWIQCDPGKDIVATAELAKKLDIGIFFREADDLVSTLRDEARMKQLRDNVWAVRKQFTFDHHADRLIDFFKESIKRHQSDVELTQSVPVIDLDKEMKASVDAFKQNA